MTSRSVSVRAEVVLYLVVVCLAAGLRLSRLDWPPLTGGEARQALGAAWRTPGASAHWIPPRDWAPESPAYNALTRWVFQVGGASDSLARLIPALAGVGLVLVPLWMRPRLGRAAALMTSSVLAVSPTLVSVSRTAGGESLAVLGIGACLGLLFGSDRVSQGRMFGAAVAAGLALASGPALFTGCLGVLAAYLGLRLFRRGPRPGLLEIGLGRWGPWLATALAAALLVSTSLGTSVGDSAGVPNALGEWLQGWTVTGDTHALTVLFLLLLFEPLAILFGVGGLAHRRGSADALMTACGAWAVGALFAALAYPMRAPASAAWVVLPLAVLAGRALADLAEGLVSGWSWIGHGTLIPVLVLFAAIAGMQLSNYASGRGPGGYLQNPVISLWLAIAVLGVAAVMAFLYAAGWSSSLAFESVGVAVEVEVAVKVAVKVGVSDGLIKAPTGRAAEGLSAKAVCRSGSTSQSKAARQTTITTDSRLTQTRGGMPRRRGVTALPAAEESGGGWAEAGSLSGWVSSAEMAGMGRMRTGRVLPLVISLAAGAVGGCAVPF